MASIRKRETNGTVRWQVRWRDALTRKQRSESFPTEKQAKSFRGKVDQAGQRDPAGWTQGVGFVPDEPAQSPTVAQWCEQTLKARSGITENSRKDYLNQMSRHVTPPLATTRVVDVVRSDISLWVSQMEKKQLAPKTIVNIHGTLSSCFADAVKDGIIDRNPAEGIGLPSTHGIASGRTQVVLTRDEMKRLLTAVPDHHRPFVQFLAGTGCRIGEAMALQKRHVNLATGRVQFVQSFRREPGGYVLAPPKTKRSVRVISIDPGLVKTLATLVADKTDDEFVFTNPSGSRIHPPRWRADVWYPAVRAAKLSPEPVPHDLRHTHVSWLIEAGVPLPKIQRRVGHEKITTTIDTYGHLLPESEDEVLAALSGALDTSDVLSHP